MKKPVCIILSLVMLFFVLSLPVFADNKAIAAKTASKVLVDGADKHFEAYNINDSNYFKLRDIAFVLSGSSNQFDVTWDGSKNAINLVSCKPYTVAGGEMKLSTGQKNVSASLTTSRVYLDGREISLTAYNIAGSNYFNLRDIAAALNLSVDYDDITKDILVNTAAKAYKGEFRDMTAQGLVAELGPGYSYDALFPFDPTIRYDPYPSVPIWLDLGLGIVGNEKYGYNWKDKLTLSESVHIAFSLKDLPDTPNGMRYNHFDLCGGVQSWQDVPMTIKVENARIELPKQTIKFAQSNGTFNVTARDSERFDPVSSWLFTGLSNGELTDLPDTGTLKEGTFKADVTLLNAKGPDKADYYSYKGLFEYRPALTAQWFKFLKSEGFNSIRFQVTWFNHTNDETYEIDKAWLKQVENTVKLAAANDIYCIINMNWDMCPNYDPTFTAGMRKEQIAAMPSNHGWLTLDGNPKVEERFASVWKQIAEHFKDYDEHLIFEAVNEPNAPDYSMNSLGAVGDPDGRGWSDIGRAGNNLNKLNQIFVDSVRSTGGNNTKRFLLVPPFFQKGVERYLSKFQLPRDPAQHVIVCMNYYLGDSAVGGGDPFPSIQKYLTANNIPAIITEFGSSADDFPYKERVDFTRKSVAQAKEQGIPIMWYAGGWGDRIRNSPSFCLYNPYTYEKAFPELIDMLMNREK